MKLDSKRFHESDPRRRRLRGGAWRPLAKIIENIRKINGRFASLGVAKYTNIAFILIAIASVMSSSAAETTTEEMIVVVKRANETEQNQHTTAAAPASEPTLEDIYHRWQTFPGQVMLDSPSGPVPMLGMDTVYDANGFPVPRLPDPYTYAVISNPLDNVALQRYLDWRRAVIRRTRIAMNRVPDLAYELGYITPETVALQKARPTDNKLVGDMRALTPESIGTPLVSDGKARELGMKLDDIPKLPGLPSPTGIEVYWFWHHRCNFCQQMARNWFAFQRQVNDAGFRAMSVNVSMLRNDLEVQNASIEVASTLEVWSVPWGDDVEYSSNTLDWVGAAKSFGITGTPTVLIINRNTMVTRQLAGAQDDVNLRTALAEVAGWPVGTWPPPRASVNKPNEKPEAPAMDKASQSTTTAPWLNP